MIRSSLWLLTMPTQNIPETAERAVRQHCSREWKHCSPCIHRNTHMYFSLVHFQELWLFDHYRKLLWCLALCPRLISHGSAHWYDCVTAEKAVSLLLFSKHNVDFPAFLPLVPLPFISALPSLSPSFASPGLFIYFSFFSKLLVTISIL